MIKPGYCAPFQPAFGLYRQGGLETCAKKPDTLAMENASPFVLRQDTGAIAHLALNRPAARNCLSLAMLAALQAEFDALAVDRRIHAVILSGSGPAFCAGHDLKELTSHRGDPDQGKGFFSHTMAQCSTLMQAIIALPQPVIAAVEGLATAAGCQLVATCDLAIAGADATFCAPGVDIGLFCATPMVALSRNVASKHALAMLLTGERIDAAEAFRIGLVNRSVAAGAALAAAMALAATIATKPRHTVADGKRAFHAQTGMALPAAYDHCSALMTQNLLAANAIEGIGAFLGKRQPQWRE